MEGERSLSERREEMAKAVLPAVYHACASSTLAATTPPDRFVEEVVAGTLTITRAILAALDRAKAADRSDASFPETERRERERGSNTGDR